MIKLVKRDGDPLYVRPEHIIIVTACKGPDYQTEVLFINGKSWFVTESVDQILALLNVKTSPVLPVEYKVTEPKKKVTPPSSKSKPVTPTKKKVKRGK